MREPETNAFIVDRIKAALDVNKACATEEQRREYLIGLAYVAPPRLAVGNTFPHHRFISSRAKDTAAKFKRNRGPGWIQSDVDFAMDGEIAINGTINGNMFTEGDLAIAVEWYDRTEDDSDGLTFSKWQDTQATRRCRTSSTRRSCGRRRRRCLIESGLLRMRKESRTRSCAIRHHMLGCACDKKWHRVQCHAHAVNALQRTSRLPAVAENDPSARSVLIRSVRWTGCAPAHIPSRGKKPNSVEIDVCNDYESKIFAPAAQLKNTPRQPPWVTLTADRAFSLLTYLLLVNDPGLIPIGPLQKGSCVQSAILPNVCGGTALADRTDPICPDTEYEATSWSAPLMGGDPVITYLERTVCWERYSQ